MDRTSVSPRDTRKEDEPRNGNDRHSEDRGRSRSRDRNADKRDKDPTSYTQVYVAKLHRRTREDDLREAFSKYGRIKDVVLKHSYAFIDYEDHEAADAALREMNGKTFVNGEELVVE